MFPPEKVDMKRMIEMELEKLEVEISVKSLFLKTELEEIEGLFDVNMLRSIIRNLINNAVHFTPNRGNVTIILKRKNKTIVFEVRDTGIGISAEKIKELLAENADTSNQQGFGILLTKTFAKYHNATLQIESEQGKGTTVRVLFNNRI
jgi:signal transduction histidine kinase